MRERFLDAARLLKRLRQRDRIFHREFRSRTDREVRGVQRVTKQHEVFKRPVLILHQQKLDPLRVIRKQRLSVQVCRKNLAEIRSRFIRRHLFESGFLPRLRVALDNEGARLLD